VIFCDRRVVDRVGSSGETVKGRKRRIKKIIEMEREALICDILYNGNSKWTLVLRDNRVY
jgi:hypothetical protein